MFTVRLALDLRSLTPQECSLKQIRAQVDASPQQTVCNLQLQALSARDLTDATCPFLATSDPSYSPFARSVNATRAREHADDGASAPDESQDDAQKPSIEPNDAKHELVRMQLVRRQDQPMTVTIVLHTFHLEWNPPCLATLKRFFSNPIRPGAIWGLGGLPRVEEASKMLIILMSPPAF